MFQQDLKEKKKNRAFSTKMPDNGVSLFFLGNASDKYRRQIMKKERTLRSSFENLCIINICVKYWFSAYRNQRLDKALASLIARKE